MICYKAVTEMKKEKGYIGRLRTQCETAGERKLDPPTT
jgi:hypothetical protein